MRFVIAHDLNSRRAVVRRNFQNVLYVLYSIAFKPQQTDCKDIKVSGSGILYYSY